MNFRTAAAIFLLFGLLCIGACNLFTESEESSNMDNIPKKYKDVTQTGEDIFRLVEENNDLHAGSRQNFFYICNFWGSRC